MTRRVLVAVSAALLATVVLTACAPGSSTNPDPTGAPPDSLPAEPSGATPTGTPDPDANAADPTCETIIPGTTATDFLSIGWTSQSEPFRIGATEVSGGILCKWSDGSATADRVQMFGWAPIDDAAASTAVRDLTGSGWKREEGENGQVYITENPEWLGGRGVDGYGITYLFGDGWVKVADTKQSLVLIDWPRTQR